MPQGLAKRAENRPDPIRATQAKYIKLGRGGKWERMCLEDGTMRFGYGDIPHELALTGDRESIRRLFIEKGVAPTAATSHANQVLAFYHDRPDTLWITISAGYLWWCSAHLEVEYLGTEGDQDKERGARLRRTIDGWRNKSLGGQPLRVSDLNGGLTKVAAFRATLCKVEMLDYLLRKINDQELPVIREARRAKGSLLQSIEGLMKLLPWREFELLVDLVFAESGWRRIGETGGTQKTVDIELALPSTGERAFVQVKSRTNQAQLDDYVERLADRGEARMFYVYHSGPDALETTVPRVVLVGPGKLSEMVLSAGLFDWLLEKAG